MAEINLQIDYTIVLTLYNQIGCPHQSKKPPCKNISHTRKSWKNKMRWHGNMLNFKHNYENTNEPFSRKMCQRRHFWNTGTALFIYIWKASSPWRSYAGIAWLVTLRHDVDEKLCHFSSCCIILFKKFVRCLDKCKKRPYHQLRRCKSCTTHLFTKISCYHACHIWANRGQGEINSLNWIWIENDGKLFVVYSTYSWCYIFESLISYYLFVAWT